MTFNSYTFLLFFALVWGVYQLPLSWRVKKVHLLLASYLFYAAWNPPFVVLLWFSTLVDGHAARRIHAAQRAGVRRAWLGVSLASNLGLLAYFKYGTFLLTAFQDVLASVGVAYTPPAMDIILPMGISFYTFQTLSYTLDVYLRRAKPWPSMLDYALYVTFFPQLVAGPIVRGVHFLPQLRAPARASASQLGWGLALLVIGLFQKCVLADAWLAPIVEKVYVTGALAPTLLDAWGGTLAFAGQIVCDFGGYSLCAIGVAAMLGFVLPDNFRSPYAARGLSDFWRRWHITLSSWLRDYLYIPLGGNRVGRLRTSANLMIVMLLGGLWHGAAWTFVVWGGLHGAYLMAERLLARRWGGWALWRTALGRVLLTLTTFLAVCVAWVFFRAPDFPSAFAILAAMFAGPFGLALLAPGGVLTAVVLTGGILGVHAVLRERRLETLVARMPWWSVAVILALMTLTILLTPGEDRAFIYFQF